MKRFRFRLLNALLLTVLIVLLAVGLLLSIRIEQHTIEIFLLLLLAFCAIWLVAIRIVKHLTLSLEDAARVANELAHGNFKARTFDYRHDETGHLSQWINALARNLEDMEKSYEIEQSRLFTLIENMGSGALLIDARGYVTFINRAYKEMFGYAGDEWMNGLYYEVLGEEDVVEIIDETFLTEQKTNKHLQIPLEIERRHFHVESTPITARKRSIKGIVVVLHDITELKKLEQMRKDFVSNVSHELKTPVKSLKGFAETLLDGAVEDQAIRDQFLGIILKESDRLQRLIEDLLELSKIEQDHFQLMIERANLKELLSETVFMLENRAKSKGIAIEMKSEGDTTIEGDPNRLKQIFINLLTNSITYTSSGGRIDLSLIERDTTVDFMITDTGIGIRKEEIPRIFERFYRVDKARSRESGGTGLGLAIVKHLVEAHHGKITVESELNQGTTFQITFWKKQNLH